MKRGEALHQGTDPGSKRVVHKEWKKQPNSSLKGERIAKKCKKKDGAPGG